MKYTKENMCDMRTGAYDEGFNKGHYSGFILGITIASGFWVVIGLIVL